MPVIVSQSSSKEDQYNNFYSNYLISL